MGLIHVGRPMSDSKKRYTMHTCKEIWVGGQGVSVLASDHPIAPTAPTHPTPRNQDRIGRALLKPPQGPLHLPNPGRLTPFPRVPHPTPTAARVRVPARLPFPLALYAHAHLVLWREAVHLLVVDGAHEGGLAHAVVPAQTVAPPTLQAQARVVEQDLAAWGPGERWG